jgi:SAM-dependent methyltransferase
MMSGTMNNEERHQIEERFHDIRAQESVDDFYSFGALDDADTYLWRQLGDLKGKHILEIGCGDGKATLKFAQAGAIITAIDISGGMVELTKKIVAANGYTDRVQGIHMKGEEIDFQSESFDVVYGHSVLHHMDLDKFTPACAKILRKNGIACFLEPLDYNPIINFFRKHTPHRRTPTEQPLKMNQLSAMAGHFDKWEHREFMLLSLVAFFWYYGIRIKWLFQATMKMFNSIDRTLFKILPPLRRFAWVTVVRFEK